MTKPDSSGEAERSNASPPLDEAQRDELRARLTHHRAHPDEPGVTLDEIRRKLGVNQATP